MPQNRKYSGPLLPRTKSVRQVNRRNKYAKKTPFMPSLNRQIKMVSLSQSETKTATQYVNSINLYHNVTHYVTNLLHCTQGLTANPGTNANENRIGNEVIARGIKLKLQYISDPSRPNMNIRGFVFKYETSITPADTNFWVGPAGAGLDQNRMLDFPDTRSVTILRTFRFQPRGTINYNNEETKDSVANYYKDIWIPLNNKKIKYDANDSSQPKYVTYGFATVAYDANNTLETDIIAYLGYSIRFYYKDP